MSEFNIEQLIQALNKAYDMNDSIKLREILNSRYQFPVTLDLIKKEFGTECSSNLRDFN